MAQQDAFTRFMMAMDERRREHLRALEAAAELRAKDAEQRAKQSEERERKAESRDDDLDQILSAAEKREQEAYASFIAKLSETDQRVMAAHMMFALVHAGVRRFADASRQRGRPVYVDCPSAGQVRAYANVRQATCSCWLLDDSIVVELLGGPPRHDWRRVWRAPPDPKPEHLFAVAREITATIASHVACG